MSENTTNKKIKFKFGVFGNKVIYSICSAIDKITMIIFTCIAIMISNSMPSYSKSIIECILISILFFAIDLLCLYFKDYFKANYTNLENDTFKAKVMNTDVVLEMKVSLRNKVKKTLSRKDKVLLAISIFVRYINIVGYAIFITPTIKDIINQLDKTNYHINIVVAAEILFVFCLSFISLTLSEYFNIKSDKEIGYYGKAPESDINADISKAAVEKLYKQLNGYKTHYNIKNKNTKDE